jgi:UDP-GlcNAc:undecaprenyl-phosphate GlcNAc-1-phosphate transferase
VYDEPAQAPASSVTPVIVNFMYKRRIAEVVLDVCLVSIAYYAAWRLRFEGVEWATYFPSLVASLPIAIAVQMIALFVFGAYRGAWRHFGLMDGVVFGKAVLSGTLTLIAVIAFLYRFQNYSRGVFIIYASLLMILLAGSRASFRLIGEFVRRRRTGTRLVIYGAGAGGSLLVRELLSTGGEIYQMIGFIDDDPGKHSFRLQGYPVLGGERKLLDLIDRGSVDVVVIGTRSLEAGRFERIHGACEHSKITLQRLSLRIETLVSP